MSINKSNSENSNQLQRSLDSNISPFLEVLLETSCTGRKDNGIEKDDWRRD